MLDSRYCAIRIFDHSKRGFFPFVSFKSDITIPVDDRLMGMVHRALAVRGCFQDALYMLERRIAHRCLVSHDKGSQIVMFIEDMLPP